MTDGEKARERREELGRRLSGGDNLRPFCFFSSWVRKSLHFVSPPVLTISEAEHPLMTAAAAPGLDNALLTAHQRITP